MNGFLQASHGALLLTGLGLLFAFSNGFRDSSTIVATVVSTRALTPLMAFFLCALFELTGALMMGTAVAATINRRFFGAIPPGTHEELMMVLTAALVAALLWGAVSWWQAWPTSNNHALIAGLTGASWMAWGSSHLERGVIAKVFLVLILSPLAGFVLSYVMTALIRFLAQWMTPRMLPVTERIHVLSCMLVSGAHGFNDGQLAMGVLVLGLGISHGIPFSIRWMVAGCLAAGVLMGGRRILKKLGMNFYRIRVIQGLGAQLTSALTILTCALHGFPASTTHVITGSIVGAGVAHSGRRLNWLIAREIVFSWLMTIPVVGVLGSIVYGSLKYLSRMRS